MTASAAAERLDAAGPHDHDAPAVSAVAASRARIAADGRAGVWIDLVAPEDAIAAVAAGSPRPLAGRTVAVKANIDVAGLRTTAGCPAYGSIAERSAPAVRALEGAGAVVVGTTSLDQFATGLVGTRSPHGACPNAHWPHLVSGGSSSGSAVAVAAGQVDLALGTDTAGSGRVPAAANGIVGLKPTRSWVSRTGVVPACRSLDCVSVFARTVGEAAAALAVLATTVPDPADPWSEPARVQATDPARTTLVRVGVARLQVAEDFDGDELGLAEHRAALEVVQAATRAPATEVDLGPFLAAGALLYGGAFVAERWASVGAFLDAHPGEVDPTVAAIIGAGRDVAGWEVFRDQAELRRLDRQTRPTWDVVDVLALPTVPRLPTVAEVAADPFGPNTMLGRFTTFVNLLDLCALTLPVGPALRADRPPPSLTLVAPAGADHLLIELGAAIEARAAVTPREGT